MRDNGANFNLGNTIGKIEMTTGTISGEKSALSSLDVKATGLSGNISLSAGTKGGNYSELKAEGILETAEIKC